MEVTLQTDDLTAERFNELRAAVGWETYPAEQAALALLRGLHDVVAYQDGRAIGMGRLVGDGALYWYIQDVVVLPELQGLHVGRRIIEALMHYVETHSLPQTTVTVGLMAAQGKEAFYRKLGFIERPEDTLGAGMTKKVTAG